MGKARTLNSHLIINALIHIDIRSMILLGFSTRHGAKRYFFIYLAILFCLCYNHFEISKILICPV